MSFSKSFKEVLEEAKKAFGNIEHTPYEKAKISSSSRTKPFYKKIGFVTGTREVLVYQ